MKKETKKVNIIVKKRRVLHGVVVSDKMDKTVVVRVDRLKMDSKYKKRYKVSKKYKAHDEENKLKEGDLVEITENKPMSKDKKWVAQKIK
ncbi:MAG: 30S ribosomal protein S17 [Candidatus Paceibacterota bacterium]|jgi:small subunit ribosomal protein S17